MKNDDHRGLTYDDFRLRANDDTWTENEKIGFPDSYRGGAEEVIFADILAKLPILNGTGRTVMDIGCGCGPLARVLMAHCADRRHKLIMVDSSEVLDQLPPSPGTELRPHRFPRDPAFLDEFRGAVDAVLLYSVIHHEFLSGDLWTMFDAVCGLLADGARALFGDIPNRSMRARLFASPNGRAFHRAFTRSDTEPPVPPYGLAPGEIDDAVVFALLMRARSQGIHGFVLPQSEGLPFANRREDVLLHHP